MTGPARLHSQYELPPYPPEPPMIRAAATIAAITTTMIRVFLRLELAAATAASRESDLDVEAWDALSGLAVAALATTGAGDVLTPAVAPAAV
jgi:hypothetical protein